MRESVAIWKAGGMTDEDIARALNIDAETMKKHFAFELRTAWAGKVAKVIEAQYEAAVKGNVSAQDKFLSRAKVVGAMEGIFAPERGKLATPRASRTEKLGKKEKAQVDALSAGENSDWGDDLKIAGRA